MTRRTPFRPAPPRSHEPAPDTVLLDGAVLSRQDRSADDDAASAATPAGAGSTGEPAESGQWRAKLAALTRSGALTPQQETEFFRLFQAQESDLREALPRLLAELEPHFGADGEAAARERFTQALHALKRRQEDEVARLLASMGIESPPPAA